MFSSPASAIVGGHEGGDDAVVALERGGEVVCSGTLVAPTLVVTAAHCVGATPPDAVIVGRASNLARRITPSRFVTHPRYQRATLKNDLAVVVLGEPVQGPYAILPVGDAALGADAVGTPVTLTGFGRLRGEGHASARRREGTARISRVDAESFDVAPAPSLTCGGDSGGAAFVDRAGERTLLGVVSSGDLTCERRTSLMRLDGEAASFVTALLPDARTNAPPFASPRLRRGVMAALGLALVGVAVALRRRRSRTTSSRCVACSTKTRGLKEAPVRVVLHATSSRSRLRAVPGRRVRRPRRRGRGLLGVR